MKYDLSKLSKDEITILVKNISPAFAGVYCFAPSQKNKIVKPVPIAKKGVIELYDNERKIHDKWGEYNVANNSLYVQAWDHPCYWSVGVYLYEDHFNIPKYKNAVFPYETEENFIEYRKIVKQIFDKKRQNQIDMSPEL